MPWLDGVRLSQSDVDDWLHKGRSSDLGEFVTEYLVARANALGCVPSKEQLNQLRKEMVKAIDEVIK